MKIWRRIRCLLTYVVRVHFPVSTQAQSSFLLFWYQSQKQCTCKCACFVTFCWQGSRQVCVTRWRCTASCSFCWQCKGPWDEIWMTSFFREHTFTFVNPVHPHLYLCSANKLSIGVGNPDSLEKLKLYGKARFSKHRLYMHKLSQVFHFCRKFSWHL